MATIDDINKQRDAALALLQRKLDAADDMRNAGQTGLDDTIRSLRDQRDAVDAQAYAAGLNDEAMTDALDALKSATSDMNATAAKMVSVTTFISNVASLGTATNKVVTALKGVG